MLSDGELYDGHGLYAGDESGFTNGVSTTNEYTYDHNGYLTKDSNKGITNISYNVLRKFSYPI